MAAAPPEGGGTSQPLNSQTWVLRVSIHCEGCKKKVKKILSSVPGVNYIEIDANLHRVIVTGDVDANTLLKKLEKSGKHAELWPYFPPNPPIKPNKTKQPSSEIPPQQQIKQKSQPKNPTVEAEKVAVGINPKKHPEVPKSPVDNTTENTPTAKSKEIKSEEHAAETSTAVKKKKKKGQKGHSTTTTTPTTTATHTTNTNNNDESAPPMEGQKGNSTPTPTTTTTTNPHSQPGPMGPNPDSMGPPPQFYPQVNRAYEYGPGYYNPPPMYGVSYNTAYPTYATSYYSAPPPYSYAYMHGGDVAPPPPSDWNAAGSSQPADSFEMFSDENPNACSLM